MSVNLTGTNQKLKVITNAAVQTQVVASGRDNVSGAQTPISQDTNFTTATTLDIVSAPGASTQRMVDDVEINIVGSGSQQVTVQKDVGGTVFQLLNVILGGNERAHFTNDMGWRCFDAFGREKGVTVGYSQLSVPQQVLATNTTLGTLVGATAVLVEGWAPGGGGGGANTAVSSNSAGSGGSSGGYFACFIIGVASTISVTIGAVGAAGAAAGGTGGTGGNVVVVHNGVTMTAFGGIGGLGMTAASTILLQDGAVPPAISTCSPSQAQFLAGAGDGGMGAQRHNGAAGGALSGDGGNGLLGVGAPGGGRATQGAGKTGTGFNAGGAGGCSIAGGAAAAGAAGLGGFVQLTYFTG